MTGRGQTFTLEAFVAAILLLATVAFALQVVSISANTASGADTELRDQQAGLAGGVLDQAAADGTLRSTTLYWNENESSFHGADADEGYYVSQAPPTAFGDSLAAMFDARRVRYNVNVSFVTPDGDRGRQRLVESGTPGDGAVRVTETVTLYDDSRLVDADEDPRATNVSEVETEFYAPDARPERPVYNVLRVEVVLWQT